MRNTRLIAPVFAVLVLVTACGGDYDESEPTFRYPPPSHRRVPPSPPTPDRDLPNEDPYDSVYFDNPGVSPFLDADRNRLSTFALDVDTGSYTVGRRFVRDGNLPERDSVRVEEYVNYFDQDYPTPPPGDGLGLTIDGGRTPFMQNRQNQVVRIGVQASAAGWERRDAANLVFVVDTSGSMKRGDRLELVKDSLALLASSLHADDTVAIVEYGSRARVVMHPTAVEEENEILRAIDSLSPNGRTNAAEGLQLGYWLANKAFRRGGINRVILCSDGVANMGRATDAEGILELISDDAARGIELVTVGFGMGNYNDVLMEQLADQGDGFYAYVDTIAEAGDLFVRDLEGTLQTVAKDAKIQVEFDPRVVESWRLVGFENRSLDDDEFYDDSVDAGEIGAGHTVTALYEIEPAHRDPGDLGVVRLRWRDPRTNSVRQVERAISPVSLAGEFDLASSRFQLDVVVAQYAEVLRDSVWADRVGVDLVDVSAWADYVAKLIPDDADVAEFAELVSRAARLRR